MMPRRRYGILGFFYRKLRRSSAYSASSFSEPSTLWWSNSLSHINPEEERKRSIEVASDSKDKIEKKRQKRSKSSEHLEELGSTQMLDKMVGYKETKFIECLIDEGFSVEELLVLKDLEINTIRSFLETRFLEKTSNQAKLDITALVIARAKEEAWKILA